MGDEQRHTGLSDWRPYFRHPLRQIWAKKYDDRGSAHLCRVGNRYRSSSHNRSFYPFQDHQRYWYWCCLQYISDVSFRGIATCGKRQVCHYLPACGGTGNSLGTACQLADCGTGYPRRGHTLHLERANRLEVDVLGTGYPGPALFDADFHHTGKSALAGFKKTIREGNRHFHQNRR